MIVFPDWIRSNVSLLNVLNVLNPPQNPTINNGWIQWLETPLFDVKWTKKAKITQDTIFAIKVPKGKLEVRIELDSLDTPKRAKLPNPPPRKI